MTNFVLVDPHVSLEVMMVSLIQDESAAFPGWQGPRANYEPSEPKALQENGRLGPLTV